MCDNKNIESVDISIHRILNRALKTNNFSGSSLDALTSLDIRILRVIAENPNKQIKDILQILGIPNSTMTSIINKLEKKGILRRAYSYEDRRSYILELTDYGGKVNKEHQNLDIALAKAFLKALGNEEDQRIFAELFQKATSILR